ncbi:glycylpeptide N-tetradecanoyltransferase 2-like [Penaeus chinensis]|uniref:glycylpeptide N-tetradecanoyltransferase 2-like n=1 Tax=Penaeus chinensis TaxID=139456 RepID=UPI001FB592D0|nr:glycylpeptide N-tetradecanoyltransferase 2-like [Penaeus chinensis]
MAAAPDRSEGVNADHGPHSKARKGKKMNKNKENKEKDLAIVNGESEPSTSGLVQTEGLGMNAHVPPRLIPEVERYMRKMQLQNQKEYHFWNTQPVPKINEEVGENVNEAIEPDKKIEDIKQEPYNLPDGFKWDTLDLTNEDVLQNLYNLLNENYVEDDDNMFRFDYSKEFLRWALMPPSWKPQWHVGVRVTKSNRLVGFISAVPAHIRIYDHTQAMVEINFLCVHKKLRAKRLAPVLIKEITRRVNLTGIFQAVYTAGVTLPKPVASCRYWHRSLNPKKLIDVKFSHLGKNMTMQRTLKLYRLPTETATTGFRRLKMEDVDQAHTLLETYLKKFDLAPVFSREEFLHWFLPQDNIIDSYIVENNGKISDFMSYYTLPSTVMHHPTYKTLKAAYSFYNVSTATPWKILMKDVLITAKNSEFDVFNALDLMENSQFLDELKFGQGDGNLQYYLYNWRCPNMTPQKVGLVLQ